MRFLRLLSRCRPRHVALLLIVAFFGLIEFGAPSVLAGKSAESAKRVDAPFTLAVKTPHVAWARPWGGKTVHALVVPSVSEGRTLVELAERFPITYKTVMIDTAWDVNTWTVGTGKNYEARTYKLVYKYLAEDLASNAHYDVIVLPGLFGWNRLPQDVREGILKRVRAGTGLVLIHPTTGIPAPGEPKVNPPMNIHAPDFAVPSGGKLWEVSPLIDCLSDQLDSHGKLHVLPRAVTTGEWQDARPGFITNNVPFDTFPGDFLKHYKYHLGPESTLLVKGPGGEPIVATKTYGKGRVVALGYVNHGLSPDLDWKFLGKENNHWWEYFYSLLGRSIMWAGGEQPRIHLQPMRVEVPHHGARRLSVTLENHSKVRSAELSVNLVSQWGDDEGHLTKDVHLRRGRNRIRITLPDTASGGRNNADVILSAAGKRYAWGSVSFSLPQPDHVLSIATAKKFYKLGDPLHATVRIGGTAPAEVRVDLLDNRNRLIGSVTEPTSTVQGGVLHATVPVGNYTTNIGWVRVALLGEHAGRKVKIDQDQTRVDFVRLDRKFGAYELILPWYGPPSYEPWEPTLESQFRKIGVTVEANPRNNFKLITEVHAPGFGVYWYRRKKYIEQKDEYLKTHNTKYLIRKPDLSSHKWLDTLQSDIIDSMGKYEPYGPLAYYLADESSLTSYGDPLDFSWSKPTLQGLRRWLRGQYPDLSALNKEWDTNYKTWDDVMPLTTSQAQAKDDYAGWMDHRTYMEQVFAHAMQVAASTVKSEDPGGLPSISGTQGPGPSNAVNWYLLDHIVGYLQPYSSDNQDDLHRSIHAGQIMTGFTGYQDFGVRLRHQLWHRLLEGQIGASLFWQYTALNADLTLTQQGHDLSDLTNEFRNEGLALLLRGAKRANCGIAVHYSLLSVRSHWITDGHIAAHKVTNGDATSRNLKRFHQNRTNWLHALRDDGYQYDFLTTEQIDKGRLSNYKVLILPDSISLSPAEVIAIRNFVANGGLLISDGEIGLMDQHARWEKMGLLDNVLGIHQTSQHNEPEDQKPLTLHLALGSNEVAPTVIPAEPNLKVISGQAKASSGSTPFLVKHSFGAGRAITLNFWLTNYAKLQKTGENRPVLEILRHYLEQAGVKPIADVHRASSQPVQCSEVVKYSKSEVDYLAVLPGLGCQDVGPVTVRFPSPRYVYNLREHRLLGHTSQVKGTLVAGAPLFLAFSAEPVGKLSVSALGAKGTSPKVAAGSTIAFRVHLSMPYGHRNFPDAIHVEVRNPKGKLLNYYDKNLQLKEGMARFSVPLALNDMTGDWSVTVREPYTHETSTANFTVVSPGT